MQRYESSNETPVAASGRSRSSSVATPRGGGLTQSRRTFMATSAAAMGVAVLPPFKMALPPPLTLYSVCDSSYDPFYFDGWCDAVWAHSEREALQWARDNYGGHIWCTHDGPCEPELMVLSQWSGDGTAAKGPGSRETRTAVLRQAGWMEEGDGKCDCCGLAEFDGTWPVCKTCYCCAECRDESCEDCKETKN